MRMAVLSAYSCMFQSLSTTFLPRRLLEFGIKCSQSARDTTVEDMMLHLDQFMLL